MVCAATEGLGGVAAGTLKRQWDQRMIDGEAAECQNSSPAMAVSMRRW